ncbi:hypothetical protein K435DRAFT_880680 [Dendrothele bispora CBS 962.96]|uniref:Uncharacterized protein n=1 Tax=Dendrothele bispora (strain CBS 962.96) TaxID=1314807 RepID=A0A4S8KK65_DENBC|nr:hypothetical protein K435DRAFT_880680 [Dendrothele bispora CBS 962.96]
MCGVLYTYISKVFPALHRGTGDSLCSSFIRIIRILAPVIKVVTISTCGSSSSRDGGRIDLCERDVAHGIERVDINVVITYQAREAAL